MVNAVGYLAAGPFRGVEFMIVRSPLGGLSNLRLPEAVGPRPLYVNELFQDIGHPFEGLEQALNGRFAPKSRSANTNRATMPAAGWATLSRPHRSIYSPEISLASISLRLLR